MVRFVGAGPGAADLITLRGARLLREADVIIYAGSLVNPALLEERKLGCAVYDSSRLTLEEVLQILETAEAAGQTVVRLHSGDPSLYGTLREQTAELDRRGIPWDVTPGVSSFGAAAAALGVSYTAPGVSQSVILTRIPGRTAVPDGERLSALAGHGASMAVFLSAGLAEEVRAELLAGGCAPDTPAAIVYRASWPEEEIVRCTADTIPEAARAAGIERTALILAGDFLRRPGAEAAADDMRSRLYDPSFTTGYRKSEDIPDSPDSVDGLDGLHGADGLDSADGGRRTP